MTTIDKLISKGIDLRNKITGNVRTLCPQCSELRKKKRDLCLSVDIDQGVWNCFHCGWKGAVHEDETIYDVPEYNNSGLSDKALIWIVNTRKISKSTAMRFELFSEDHKIGFPYYENGKVLHIKYRTADKKFLSTKNTKLIPFGMQLEFDLEKPLIICEGEFDAMSFYEAGHNAISCSNGAGNLAWLDNSYNWIDRFKSFIIAYDNDEKGINGRNELARRLGKERCSYFQFGEFKDANELLIAAKNNENWKEIFNAYFDYIVPFPLDGIVTVNDLRSRIFDLRKSGFPKGELTGFPNMDEIIQWAPGQLAILTGIPSHGKSEFLDQLAIRLMDLKWLIFSPENIPEEAHFSKIIEKKAKKPFFSMTNQELSNVMDELEDYFHFCDIEEIKTVDDILDITKKMVLQKGIKGVIIDPYSRIEHKYIGKKTETEYVREILDNLGRMAKQLGILVFLVAHPTKIQKNQDGTYPVPNLYSISGSAHFFNAADYGFTVYRRPQGEGIQDLTEVHIQKVRFKWYGEKGMATFEWQKETGNYIPFGF